MKRTYLTLLRADINFLDILHSITVRFSHYIWLRYFLNNSTFLLRSNIVLLFSETTMKTVGCWYELWLLIWIKTYGQHVFNVGFNLCFDYDTCRDGVIVICNGIWELLITYNYTLMYMLILSSPLPIVPYFILYQWYKVKLGKIVKNHCTIILFTVLNIF